MKPPAYDCIVIGVSSGGAEAIPNVLAPLPADYPIPIILVRHLHPSSRLDLHLSLWNNCRLPISEAMDKEPITPGIHTAPANYHLLVEKNRTFSLSIDARVQWARPSIDVLFESAADVYQNRLIGIVLTGANHDGAEGLQKIKANGGLALVQDPQTADVPEMPNAAIVACPTAQILPLHEIGERLRKITHEE